MCTSLWVRSDLVLLHSLTLFPPDFPPDNPRLFVPNEVIRANFHYIFIPDAVPWAFFSAAPLNAWPWLAAVRFLCYGIVRSLLKTPSLGGPTVSNGR